MGMSMPPMGSPMQMAGVRMPRLPFRTPRGVRSMGVQVVAGVLAVAAASLVAFVIADHFDDYDADARTAFIIAIAGAVIGGVLTMVRLELGPPLAVGGVALFFGNAVTLAVTRIDIDTAFHTSESKLILAGGIVGLIAALVCLSLFGGKPNSALGGIIAFLALVAVGCSAILVHIDEVHDVLTISGLAGELAVAIVIVVAALKGRLGVLAAVIAGGAQVPGWLQLALHHDDRRLAAIAGLAVTVGVVLIGLIGTVAALTASEESQAPGPAAATVSTVVTPMVAPWAVVPVSAGPRTGAVLVPVSVGMTASVNRSQPPSPIGMHGMVDPATGAGVAAQWAPDPFERFQVRYWNGSRWTDHVSTNGVTALDPV